ncbi:M20 family metallopeptidase [Catalinimonas alkaloidigena]|uniref:M20 metallopeptidase family protein n=1 Tax=Catalinimonas alkaloidigena TaxID=1075417 RepID=UPI001FDF0484|nr:amidohydrolase [Catalinimonas alkaloidigena]
MLITPRLLIAQNTATEASSLEELYRQLHAHPELSFHETETAARLAREWREAGFEVTEQVGGNGVVAVLKNGKGPTLLIRTDMDALPVEEATGLPYASEVTTQDDAGQEVHVMHACGHDLHMTVAVGTARALSSQRNQWKGTLVMIGQPAEERSGGANAMLDDGLFTRFPQPDYALALHASPTLEAGKVGYVSGYALANVDMVDITVHGRGGHGAYPHTTLDPVVLSARLILDLQTIVSREISPLEPAVLTVGSIHGGTKGNVIPNEVRMELTLRSYSDEVRNQLIEKIKRTCHGVALSAGVPDSLLPEIQIRNESTPSVYNDPALTEQLQKVFVKTLGSDRVEQVPPVMAGEDFARYGRQDPKIPIMLFWLGTVSPEKLAAAQQGTLPLPSLHSAQFAPHYPPAIRTGVQAMTQAALALFNGKKK